MVAGMTPSTVSWEFVSAIHKAGYHVELAGGGLPKQQLFKEAMEKYASYSPYSFSFLFFFLFSFFFSFFFALLFLFSFFLFSFFSFSSSFFFFLVFRK
jgi:enoyl reductase-like protein